MTDIRAITDCITVAKDRYRTQDCNTLGSWITTKKNTNMFKLHTDIFRKKTYCDRNQY